MEALIIFRTPYGGIKKIAKKFKGVDNIDNYIALMSRKYGWMVDELFY